MKLTIMYPCSFGNINKIEPDYNFELELAKKYNINTLFIDFDLFLNSKKLKLNRTISKDEQILYRGWMINPNQYNKLFSLLEELGVKMIIPPALFENVHLFPNSYDRLKSFTPKTIWFKDGEKIDWNKVKNTFDKWIIKDYVKSVKGFDFPVYFDGSYTNEQLDSYIDKFKELRGDLYTGGIVLKEYTELKKTNNHTHEFRAFYINGFLVSIYPNSDNSEDLVPIYEAQMIKPLYSDFYTVDFAETIDGKIIVIEVGDGQVSGFPSEKEAEQVYKVLNKLSF